MEAAELIGGDEFGAIDFHFPVESIIDNQVMSHSNSMRLLQSYIIHNDKYWCNTSIALIREMYLLFLFKQTNKQTNLHWMSLSIMIISNLCIIEISYSLLCTSVSTSQGFHTVLK